MHENEAAAIHFAHIGTWGIGFLPGQTGTFGLPASSGTAGRKGAVFCHERFPRSMSMKEGRNAMQQAWTAKNRSSSRSTRTTFRPSGAKMSCRVIPPEVSSLIWKSPGGIRSAFTCWIQVLCYKKSACTDRMGSSVHKNACAVRWSAFTK